MKKHVWIMSLLLYFGIASSLFSQQKIKVNSLTNISGVITRSDFKPVNKGLSPVARKALQKGEKPGEFKNVSYTYSSRVRVLSPVQKNTVYSGINDNGIVNVNALKNFKPSPDSIYVDPESQMVMQFAPVGDKEMIAYRPQLNEIFKEINIPLQEVQLSLANTTYTAENATVFSIGGGDDYTMVMHFDSVTYKLKKGDVNMQVALVGDIKFKMPRIEGKYSKNHGYKLVFKTEELAELRMYSTAKLKKEFKKPIWGFEIKAGDIGEATLGVFLVVDMNGEVKLEVKVDQGLSVEAGVRGGTKLGTPTSVHEIIRINPWSDVSYKIVSEMTAFAGVQCESKLKIYGHNALYIYTKTGGEVTVKTDNLNLDADAGFRVKVGGKIIKKKFTLYDRYFSLWHVSNRDFGGYEMNILEADAYRDYVIGHIMDAKDDTPYSGELTVYVKHPNGSKNSYKTTVNSDGYFAAQNVPMKKGDLVTVKVPDSPNESDAVACTIPFEKVNLFYADYFSGKAKGIVSAKVSKYEYLLKSTQQQGHIPQGFNPGGVVNNSSFNKVKNTSAVVNITKKIDEFRKNTLVYKGPVKIVAENTQTASQAGNTHNANIPRIKIGSVHGVKKNIPATVSKHILAQGQVNDPLGMFTVTNLNLKPSQMVRAQVNIEGFVIESEPVETDGLFVSAIIPEGVSSTMTYNTKSVKGSNAVVIVSAIRASKTPRGNVNMIMGVDLKHSSVVNPSPRLAEIPEAVKPFVFFNKTVPLKPVPGDPGVAIAETGSWSSSITFRSGADLFSPWKSSGHNFEYVSYRFKGVELGYKYYQQKCPACSSPDSFSKDIMNVFGDKANPYNTPQKVNVNTKVPSKQPKINNMNINSKKMNQTPIMH
ncbi:MAG: hypothetical protein GXO47_07890 [Chlorobi bacterium]|nr:hypothetical protein [Chlorobiota bacterium]